MQPFRAIITSSSSPTFSPLKSCSLHCLTKSMSCFPVIQTVSHDLRIVHFKTYRLSWYTGLSQSSRNHRKIWRGSSHHLVSVVLLLDTSGSVSTAPRPPPPQYRGWGRGSESCWDWGLMTIIIWQWQYADNTMSVRFPTWRCDCNRWFLSIQYGTSTESSEINFEFNYTIENCSDIKEKIEWQRMVLFWSATQLSNWQEQNAIKEIESRTCINNYNS